MSPRRCLRARPDPGPDPAARCGSRRIHEGCCGKWDAVDEGRGPPIAGLPKRAGRKRLCASRSGCRFASAPPIRRPICGSASLTREIGSTSKRAGASLARHGTGKGSMRPDHPTSPRFSSACERLASVAEGCARPTMRGVGRTASKLYGDIRRLFGLLAFLRLWPAALGEDTDDHIYCRTMTADAHTVGDTLFFTGVFAGDFYGSRQEYMNSFYEHLVEVYDPERSWGTLCWFEDTREKAEERLQAHAKDSDLVGYRVVYTNWTPDGGESGDGQLSAQPIRDFTVRIGGTEPYTERGAFGTSWTVDPNVLSICVRDHECEDGDKVAVTVNGNGVLAVEIAADWQCEDVRLGPGTHAIELRAVNGSGFKGECSHADVNTGEIMVASDREDSVQRWRHRGGAGSSARLKVTLE